MQEMNKNEHAGKTPFQRQGMLLDYINRQGSASVRELAQLFYLHEATVRRDLNALAGAGQIARVHGGAAAMDGLRAEIPLYVRETAHREIKRELARRAAALVRDGSTIFVDSSSTAGMMIPFLENRKNLRIVTDGAQTSVQLSRLKNAQSFCVGGCLRENSLCYAGSIALQNLSLFHFDCAFFSCRGVSRKDGLTDTSEEAAFFRKLLIERSEQSVFLFDHSKVGVTSFFTICPLKAVQVLVTDANLPDDWLAEGQRIL